MLDRWILAAKRRWRLIKVPHFFGAAQQMAMQTAQGARKSSFASRFLNIAAIGYVAVIVVVGWQQSQQLNWRPDLVTIAMTLILYLFSLLVQMGVWLGLVATRQRIGWADVQIYWQTLLMRRLPGGVWHWVGRASLYSRQGTLRAQTTVGMNIVEWWLLILACVATLALTLSDWPLILRVMLLLIAVALSFGLGLYWRRTTQGLMRSVWWIMLWLFWDMAAWLFGGAIVLLVATPLASVPLDLGEATRIWCIAGGISVVIIIFPAGLGIRELTLSGLLVPFMPFSTGVLVSIVIRLIFTLADVLWGMLGFLATRVIIGLRFRLAR